jgi:hypothetical protein
MDQLPSTDNELVAPMAVALSLSESRDNSTDGGYFSARLKRFLFAYKAYRLVGGVDLDVSATLESVGAK